MIMQLQWLERPCKLYAQIVMLRRLEKQENFDRNQGIFSKI